MVKDGKKIAAGLGIAAIVTTAIILATRPAKAAPPIPSENIVLSDLAISPSEVYVGQPVSITVVATNIGDISGSYEVTCEIV